MTSFTRAASYRASVVVTNPADTSEETRPVELVVLLAFFVGLMAFAIVHLDTALASFAKLAGQ